MAQQELIFLLIWQGWSNLVGLNGLTIDEIHMKQIVNCLHYYVQYLKQPQSVDVVVDLQIPFPGVE